MSKYRFYFETYFKDDSGYAVVTRDHSPITVISTTKTDALEEVFRVFKGATYRHGWSLRARLVKTEAIYEVADPDNGEGAK